MSKKTQDERDSELLIMTQHVQRSYPEWNLEEMSAAYDMAVSGQLDISPSEIVSQFSPLQFGRVMSAYKQRKEKNLELREHIEKANALAITPPAVDPEKTMTDAFAAALEHVRAGHDYEDYGNAIYDWLDEKGLIPYTPEQKWQFMDAAKNDIRAFLLEDIQSKSPSQRREAAALKEIVGEFTADSYPKSQHSRVVTRAKHLAINELIKGLAAQNIDPDTYLQQIP